MPRTPPQTLVTKREAADLLEVSLTYIVHLVKKGTLTPVHRVGAFGHGRQGAMLFDPADILAYKLQRQTTAKNGKAS